MLLLLLLLLFLLPLVPRGTGRLPVSCACTIDLDDVLRHVDELVDQPLAVHLRQDSALIIIAQCPAHRFVVHIRLVLVYAPEPRDRLAVDQLEDAPLAIRPLDVARTILVVLQQLQQELPQVCGRALARLPLHRGPAFAALPRLLQFTLLGARRVAELEKVEIVRDRAGSRLDHAGRHAAGSSRRARGTGGRKLPTPAVHVYITVVAIGQ